jgi:hypothetical protein
MFGITDPKEMPGKQLGTEKILELCPALPCLVYSPAQCMWKHFWLYWWIVWFFSSDVMVLNEIIEQAAGRQSRASEQGGKYS